MKLILKWLIGSAALFATPYLIPGIAIADFYTALSAVFVFGVLSVTLRPALGLLTLPINLLTFGLFSFVLNAFIFWLLSTIVKGFEVNGFISALLGSLFVSAVLAVADFVLHHD